MRLLLQMLLAEITHIVYHGFRGDLHPNDEVYFWDNLKKKWMEGKFLRFSETDESNFIVYPFLDSTTAK